MPDMNRLYREKRVSYNRYLIRDKRMTLIIGFKCKDGVALVSDTKIRDSESGEVSYGRKILTPLPTAAFIVGAAGYTDLFMEFNRKIPLLVNQRVAEYTIKNIEALIRTGLSRDEALDLLAKSSHTTSSYLPYVYSYENFMDDCKDQIKQISSQRREESSNPLDVLIGVKKEVNVPPTLHYVDSSGHEREVDRYYPIGAGSPYVKQFFDLLYDFDKDMYDLVALAFLTITYVQDVAKESSVGYDQQHPPEAYAVFANGRCEQLHFNNQTQVLDDIKTKINQFKELITNTEILKLQSNMPLP